MHANGLLIHRCNARKDAGWKTPVVVIEDSVAPPFERYAVALLACIWLVQVTGDVESQPLAGGRGHPLRRGRSRGRRSLACVRLP